MKNKMLVGAILLLSMTTIGSARTLGSSFDSEDLIKSADIRGVHVDMYQHAGANGGTEDLFMIGDNELTPEEERAALDEWNNLSPEEQKQATQLWDFMIADMIQNPSAYKLKDK